VRPGSSAPPGGRTAGGGQGRAQACDEPRARRASAGRANRRNSTPPASDRSRSGTAGSGIVTFDVYTQRPGPRIVAAAATASIATALASLDRYRSLDADLLLPGHGDPWRGSPAEAADQARAAGGS
jgi:hypothetical protein